MADLARLEKAFRKAHEAGNTEDARRLAAAIRAAQGGQRQTGIVEQGLSGVNEGIANILGAPVDLMTAGLNVGVSGINRLAGTEIPPIEDPVGGSGTFRSLMAPTISETQPQTTGQRYARRIGQEAGAMAVPMAGTIGRSARPVVDALMAGTSAIGSGVAGQTAEDLGAGPAVQALASAAGGLAPVGAGNIARRSARPSAPSVDDLKAQAGRLYDEAERTGVTASQQQTQQLSTQMRDLATREGIISPTGRVSTAYPKVNEALRTFDDFAQGDMSVQQMKTVRKVLNGAAKSADAEEARIARLMLNDFDDFVAPLAPPLTEARRLYHRAMKGEEVEEAMELAGVRAGQFTGSGYENALRTEFRQLDRKLTKGQMKGYSPEEQAAIARVNRGTTGSNIARDVGKLAPTGAVSMMASGGVPFMIGNAVGGPVAGSLASAATMGAGIAGRKVATDLTRRNAELAALLARGGGSLPVAPMLSDTERRVLAALLSKEAARAAP